MSTTDCQSTLAGIEAPPQPERDDELDGEGEQREHARRARRAAADLVARRHGRRRAMDPDDRRTDQRDHEERRTAPSLE